ncbi:cysteine-rich protein 2-binding protein [Zeugodacus cucurbitae]|uniref:cysteine-rich protein 2-binding protein n=1 Tax=Zeugodacus cucurbitae TaxID=28588 RepID=UPI0023D933B4|nr:cysteine-rich protein 2-binding protein [Zeugodacus cucurbitae]
MHCSYCNQHVAEEEDFLECIECESVVHAKCLRTCRPGDLLGDVFFDFTCAACMNLQNDAPSTSMSAKTATPRENFVRQRLSWFMIVVLTLYNLSVKSKGLSHHGFFHWRSHIVSFINKNWDFLMEPGTRRRKNWFGSISGNLSHYSPEFFLSGQETIQKSGWWRLAQSGLTPKAIHKKYEEFSQKRSQMRSGKKQLEDIDSADDQQENKRRRRNDSDDDLTPIPDGCSRTIPYMGRTPKVAKQLNIVDDDIKNLQQQQPLNTVQSSLMDFLAESFANYDLFSTLPNIATDTLVGGDEKHDFLPLLETHTDNLNNLSPVEVKNNVNDSVATNGTTEAPIADKFKGFCNAEDQQKLASQGSTEQFSQEDSMQTPSEYSNDADEDDEYQPRIVQVTNFQQLQQSPKKDLNNAVDEQPLLSQTEQTIKKEINSEAEQSENEDATCKDNGTVRDAESDNEPERSTAAMSVCKPSLFTKIPRRNWPWLVEEEEEASEDHTEDQTIEKKPFQQSESLTMMSEYEEIELLQKLRKIFDMEEKCKIDIPAYVRRFYRKLCVREWKREHGKSLFNLDDQINGKNSELLANEAKAQIIDRYQLISLTSEKKYKSFYARIAGSFDYEMFESPYSHRILHPFIYRDKEIAPPWLKLMCEMQFTVNGEYPFRSPIDFCYVRPNHIAAVNALLQTTFWPGIDMSECLSYPDYSVVALYKKLVVGCGFLVPDVGFNEAYISFMAVRPNWQRCGIGTFMLYHLIQTCMSKDITLHVSASNPAVVLYQKFGFKIEEIILDFYEKYLPIDSKQSRTAFFLRLLRS